MYFPENKAYIEMIKSIEREVLIKSKIISVLL